MRFEYVLMVCLPLMGVVLGQAQNRKATTAPSKQEIRAESPEHKFARSALEDMNVRAASIKAKYAKLKAITDCLNAETEKDMSLMAAYESEHGKQERHTCQLPEAEVTAAIDEYCTPMLKRAENYAGCSLNAMKEREAYRNLVDEYDSAIKTLTARLEHADTCIAVYSATIDKRVSDLTTRQSDQVNMCKSLDQYPPKK
jgi:hypothetical protein